MNNLPGGDNNLLTILIFLAISVWGGFINYIGRFRSGIVQRFKFLELLLDCFVSAFVGLIMGLIAISLDVNIWLSFALAGLAGHAGGRTLIFFDKTFHKRLESFDKSE